MAPRSQKRLDKTPASAHLYILLLYVHVYEYVSATGRNYTVVLVVSNFINLELLILFLFYSPVGSAERRNYNVVFLNYN